MEKTKQRKKKNRVFVKIVCCVALVLLIGGGIFYAKYYSVQNRQGISVASGLYFNSNILQKIQGTTDIEQVDATEIPITVNSERWSGGSTIFSIQVRNYDNNLSYNDKNLNIGYVIQFLLLDEPKGATYSVDYNGESKELVQEEVYSITPQDDLMGGSLDSDTYTLTLAMTNAKEYVAARVLVMAYPVSPDYVSNSNQQQRLLGIFEGVYSEAQLDVESAQFKVQEDEKYNEGTWKNKVDDLSGLLYIIKTKGDLVIQDNTPEKPTAIVKWDTKYLNISKYDAYYLEAQAQQNKNTGEKWLWMGEGDDSTIQYMKVAIMPYSSVELTFYKTPTFIKEMKEGSIKKEQFEGLAYAYVEKKASEDTEASQDTEPSLEEKKE